MKKLLWGISLIGLVLCSPSCHPIKRCEELPSCLKKALKDAARCKDASVNTYLFQGQKVYVYMPGSCIYDGTEDVYDENCRLICRLGGLFGNIDCENEIFYQEAEFISSCKL